MRDHGPGIDDQDLPFVFDRFYRAPSARGMPGSGLGLAIVRQVAESHGGSVRAERPSGGGALLVMRLPVIADDQEAIVGFDVPRLHRMAARHRRAPGLGLKVIDAPDGPGAYVGGVREGSPGERAGVLVGDVIEEFSGRPVASVADLEQISARRIPGRSEHAEQIMRMVEQ